MSRVLHSARWRRLSAKVIAAQPFCQLRLPGCTGRSTQGDHIIPVSVAPELALVESNIQGSCAWCNNKRQNRDLAALREPRALSFFD